MSEFGDITEVIRDRLVCIALEIGEAIRESEDNWPTLPSDERVGRLDLAMLPAWPCCRTQGPHASFCRYSVPYVSRAATRPSDADTP